MIYVSDINMRDDAGPQQEMFSSLKDNFGCF